MTLLGTSDAQLEGGRYAAARAAKAGAVGALFGGVLTWILVDASRCEAAQRGQETSAFSCMGGVLVGFVVLPFVALPVGWWLLRLLDVRPAWGVALLGVPFSRATMQLTGLLARQAGVSQVAWVMIPGVAVGYIAAALLVAPRLRLPYRVAAGTLAGVAIALTYIPFL